MTKKFLYIDDIRTPKFHPEEYVIVRSYPEAIGWMRKNGCPDFVSFDHDLGSTSDLTGYDIAKWMVEVDLDHDGNWMPDLFMFQVHSANTVGAENINCLLNNYLKSKKQ